MLLHSIADSINIIRICRQLWCRRLSDIQYLERELEHFRRLQATEGGHRSDISKIERDLAKARAMDKIR